MRPLFALFSVCCFLQKMAFAQVSLAAKTSPNIEFTFNTINEYVNGITLSNVLVLNVDAQTQWNLYVGATTSTAGEWDATTYYSNIGDDPTVGMIEIRFRNSSNTSQVTGFVQLTDIATPVDVIGDHLNAPDNAVSCDDVTTTGVNMAGDYLSRPECYKFNVDLRITPGLTYRAGLYTLRIDFVLIEDL